MSLFTDASLYYGLGFMSRSSDPLSHFFLDIFLLVAFARGGGVPFSARNRPDRCPYISLRLCMVYYEEGKLNRWIDGCLYR